MPLAIDHRMEVSAVSILLCTFNRAALLEETLGAFNGLRQPDGCTVQLIVVDNNSSDTTRAVVARAAEVGIWPVVYKFESRQGKSYALNRGLAAARGDVIALSDDDVVPDAAWLERIVSAFRTLEISFTFGKVLPRWSVRPPAELVTKRGEEIWGPLALVDYGNKPVRYTERNFGKLRFPIGANLAFARQALDRIGGWRPDLGKVNNSLIAGEDFEIFFRLRSAGMYSGLYDPANVVHHFVPAARLTRQYFRKWFFWHGRTVARMLPESYPEVDFTEAPRVFGVPRFLYRQALRHAARWVRSSWRRDRLRHAIEEMYAVEHLGILVECWHHRLARRARPVAFEPDSEVRSGRARTAG